MKTYPIDLRYQIVTAYKNNQGSMLKLACNFGVSRSFVQKVIHQEKKTGSVVPLFSRGKKPKLLGHESTVKQLMQEHPEANLKQLCQLIKQKTSIEVSPSTVYRFIHRMRRSQ